MSDPQPAVPRSPLLPRVLIVVITLWALIGYLIVPWLVHAFAPRLAADALDATLDIGDVHFDPFGLRLRMHEIVLRGPLGAATFDAQPLARIGLLDVNLSALSLLTLSPSLAVRLDAPDLRVELDENGALNLAALVPPAAGPAPETDAADEAPALPDLTVSLRIDDGVVRVIDRSRPERFETRVTDIDLALEALQIRPGDASPVDLAAELEGARLVLAGDLSTRPGARVDVALTDFPLALVDRWLADTTPARDLSGQLDASAQLAFEDGALRLEGGEATLSALAVAVDAPLQADLAVERIAVRSVAGDLLAPDLEIGSLELRAPRFAAIHERGTIAALSAPAAPQEATEGGRTADGDKGEKGEKGAEAEEAEDQRDGNATISSPPAVADPAPRIALDAVRVRDMALALTDRTVDGAPTLALDRINMELGRIVPVGGGSGDPAIPLHVDLRALDSGELTFDGTVALAPRVSGRLELAALDLTALAPWARHHAQLGLLGATLGFGADIEFAATTTLDADLQLADLDLNDPGGVRLIAWERLEVSGMRLDSGARSARIDSIALQAPAARFARLSDGSTNLDGIGTPAGALEDEPGTADQKPPSGASAAASSDVAEPADTPADEGTPAAPWSWSVGSATLNDGRLNFVDETLVIPFGTAVEAIGAELSDLSSMDDAPARIVLDGRVPPNGTMRVETSLTPLAPLDDTVFDVRFRQVPMPQLSPYTGTFAGRSIAGGRLDLDLVYRLDDGALDADNRITATALRLGPSIDSPSAMDLPLDLALALLRDSNDQIVLEVPVSGDVDDPSFDITPVIMRAVRNALVGIVSAPFRLLGSLLGGGGEEVIDRVTFPLGSATIPDAEIDRFVSLETALNQRPALRLVLAPTRAPEADRDALRIAALEARIDAVATPSGTESDARGDDAMDPATEIEKAAAVRTLYARDYGEEALAAIVAQYEEGDAALGGPGVALAGELRGRLLADTRVPDEALEELARNRALAVRDQLAAVGLDPARIRIRESIVDGELGGDGEGVVMKFDLAPGDAPASLPDAAGASGPGPGP